MRHQKKKITLDRKTAGRRSLLANLAESLFLYEKIETTKAKAKAVQGLAEKLITKAKANDLTARRAVAKVLYTENVVRKLMEQIAPRYKERHGGYTRVIASGTRVGDGAQKAIIALV